MSRPRDALPDDDVDEDEEDTDEDTDEGAAPVEHVSEDKESCTELTR